MAKVVRLTEAGGLFYSGGRFHLIYDAAAKAQCLREHANLEQGDDPFRRLRGVAWAALKKVRASPSAACVVLAEELALDPLVRTVNAEPIDGGFRDVQLALGVQAKAYYLKVSATLKTDEEINFTLEVPLG